MLLLKYNNTTNSYKMFGFSLFKALISQNTLRFKCGRHFLEFALMITCLNVLLAEMKLQCKDNVCQNDNFYKCVLEYRLDKTELIKNRYPLPSKGGNAMISFKKRSTRWTKCFRCLNVLKKYDVKLYKKLSTSGKILTDSSSPLMQNCSADPEVCMKIAKFKKRCVVHCEKLQKKKDKFRLRGYKNISNSYMKEKDVNRMKEKNDYGVYAVDCEMCTTTMGSELSRVSIADRNLNVIYDRIVQPQFKVVDSCHRFSGLSVKDLAEANTTLKEVQGDLLSIFNERTILIGHDLSNDLRVLKLCHKTVVDTAQIFKKYNSGLKCSLKLLAQKYLKKDIQNDDKHCSAQDAVTCMELIKMLCKRNL